jgi:hypothetical protein
MRTKDEQRPRPRWQVWLWCTAMDAVTGGMFVLGVVFTAACIMAWVWAIVEAPTPVQWAARAVSAFGILVLVGRLVDRWDRSRSGPASQAQVPQVVVQPPTFGRYHCTSYRALHGHLIRCELLLHQLSDSDHQASRPNGRWMWGGGMSQPRWVVDDHFAHSHPAPPPEPLDWNDPNNDIYSAKGGPDEARP